jgi:OOP family OmpA-OmpF porin
MRKAKFVALTAVTALMVSGCAIKQREWGSCTVAGAIVGAAAGGITGGATMNNVDSDASDGERGAAIGGGIAGGALIGGLLGHLLCDPLKETPVVQAAPPPQPEPETEIVELHGTHFAFDSATITDEGKAALDVGVKTMQQHPDLTVRVEGHTDSVGDETYNEQLGQRRADSVRQFLVDQGIDGGRITAVSFGETQPEVSNDTPEGRAQNRRVEIVAE